MRPHSLEELLFHMPAVARTSPHEWGANFARSVLRQARRREWSPTRKQEAAMRRLVADLFAQDGSVAVLEDEA